MKTTKKNLPKKKTMVIPRVMRSSLWPVCVLALLMQPGVEGLSPAPAVAAWPLAQLKPRDRYALIFGTVWGPDARPVYGVAVQLRRLQDKHARWEVYSNHRGEFAQRVPAGKGDYVVRADLKGLKNSEGAGLAAGQEVTVHIENDERADIGLHLTKAMK